MISEVVNRTIMARNVSANDRSIVTAAVYVQSCHGLLQHSAVWASFYSDSA